MEAALIYLVWTAIAALIVVGGRAVYEEARVVRSRRRSRRRGGFIA